MRSMNKNRPFIYANILALTINLIFMFTLFKLLGFLGPALALILADIAQAIYLTTLVIRTFHIRIKELFMWKKVLKMATVAILCLPILFLEKLTPINDIVSASTFSICYIIIYAFIVYRLRFEEIDLLFTQIKRKLIVRLSLNKL
jgi:O-antigen/teichoic acid export membrane protein